MAEYVHDDFGVVAVARDATLGELHRLWQSMQGTRDARIVVLAPKERPVPALGEGQLLTREREAAAASSMNSRERRRQYREDLRRDS